MIVAGFCPAQEAAMIATGRRNDPVAR